jgi:hypothetical protein
MIRDLFVECADALALVAISVALAVGCAALMWVGHLAILQ